MNPTDSTYNKSSIKQQSDSETTVAVTVLVSIGLTLLSFLVISSNVLVMYVYKQNKKLQVPKNYYIVSLAAADLLVGAISINFYTPYLVTGKWHLGKVVCQIWLTLDHTLITVSNITLLTIAFDRFASICFPIYHRVKFKSRYFHRTIVATWIVSLFVWAPAILIYPHVGANWGPEEGHCRVQFYQQNVPVTVVVSFFSYYIPVVILISLYWAVSKKLAQGRKQIIIEGIKNTVDPSIPAKTVFHNNLCDKMEGNSDWDDSLSGVLAVGFLTASNLNINNNNNESVCELEETPNTTIQSTVGGYLTPMTIPKAVKVSPLASTQSLSRSLNDLVRHRAYTKDEERHEYGGVINSTCELNNKAQAELQHALRLLLLVSIAFVLSWMPYHVTIIVRAACSHDLPASLWNFCYIIGWMNSLFNPICYAYGNKSFGKGFRKTLLLRKRNTSL